MVKTFWKSALLFCIVSLLLAGTALADSGPKPQLVVKVLNGPEEPYYLDLLAEGGGGNGLSQEERNALDQDMLSALLSAVPEGWHACSHLGGADQRGRGPYLRLRGCTGDLPHPGGHPVRGDVGVRDPGAEGAPILRCPGLDGEDRRGSAGVGGVRAAISGHAPAYAPRRGHPPAGLPV